MEQEIENWKPIIGYEELYEVSSWGRVRSLPTYVNHHYGKRLRKSKIKTVAIYTTGYYTTNLWKDNKLRVIKVHREMAKVFIPNPENKRTVNHKDGNKLNNHISNLEWNTHKENCQHAFDTGLHISSKGENCSTSKLTDQDVREIKILSENGIRHRTLSKIFEVHESHISLIVNNIGWKHI
jgi:hypothetical protein